eukprot:GHVQ01025366.1.p1 GENE.GHVQ01025366.1~~GHVQ01025366.1.p1  ORF type:complete len:284 (+),score=34.66 GHVQ01025366.1:222-1073(+)
MYHFEMLMTDRHVGARQHEEEVSLQSSSMRHDAAVVNERTPKFGIGRWSTCLLHFNGFSKWLPDSPTIRMMALMVSIAAAGVVLWKGRDFLKRMFMGNKKPPKGGSRACSSSLTTPDDPAETAAVTEGDPTTGQCENSSPGITLEDNRKILEKKQPQLTSPLKEATSTAGYLTAENVLTSELTAALDQRFLSSRSREYNLSMVENAIKHTGIWRDEPANLCPTGDLINFAYSYRCARLHDLSFYHWSRRQLVQNYVKIIKNHNQRPLGRLAGKDVRLFCESEE